ncbi:MAG TPA: hypothetical protein VNK03_01305 [Gammaproteobacteria bacterium]|nr:hypothetical protein [Gammaproteobacteria bacterium]
MSGISNKNVTHTNQPGYTSLFEKDFMAFSNRINHDVDERSFQISTATGTLSAQKWNGHQDKSIEKVTYYSAKEEKDPSKVITKVEFEGWRRYVAERRPTEGGRIIFHVRGLQKQSTLARMIDDKSFRDIGWMEPIVAVTEDPFLAVNFREDAIVENADYIDDLFSRISEVERLPHEIILDLKNVIALNSIDRFKKRMLECGFSEYEYEEALKLIRPTSLKEVSSPFYVSALFCRTKGKFKEARKLLKKISKMHWQFEEAIDLERSLYEQEIRENKQKYEQMVQQLTIEVVHLRSRGSIANQTSSQSRDAALTQQSNKIKIQQETEILKKTNAQLTQKFAETLPLPLAKEIIPYFQGLQGLLSKRHDQQQNTAQSENKPKTPKRQRVT